ncbi:hypothetical protein [Nocardia miyunensis]|uniref:hypothetical protein n=1 Tax=Nocardia miyunensis TaxID=282684 RepID=UPI000A029F4F|nr:hypothetical protein [Nocardia miyunensis]
MADDSAASQSGPLAALIADAKSGALTTKFSSDVRVNADEFVYIERDCQAFKNEIQTLRRIAENISRRQHWGLGETTDGLNSANTVVGWFRGKAKAVGNKDTDNNVYDILDKHYKIVDDLQTLHHTIAQQYVQQDQEFAAEYNRLKANLPPSSIGKEYQLGLAPNPGVGQS